MSVWINRCHIGDCRDGMRQMVAHGVRVQCCVSSPPFWGLRDYGTAPVEWPEVSFSPMPGLPPITVPAQSASLGLEADPWAFVGHMVLVFRLVRELLADDGVAFVNLGDTYASGGGKDSGTRSGRGGRLASPKHATPEASAYCGPNRYAHEGLKSKDMLGIPWRVAFALQADGWWLRQDVIWSKPNPLPESVRDRCTKSHEYLFLLAKSERYYFDADAIKESLTRPNEGLRKTPAKFGGAIKYEEAKKQSRLHSGNVYLGTSTGKRNKRSVWTIATAPYKEAHFATFPPALVEPCILAGSRPGDIVLDPFMGSGTVGKVALRLGRKYVGCELSEAYGELQEDRLRGTTMGFEFPTNEGVMSP